MANTVIGSIDHGMDVAAEQAPDDRLSEQTHRQLKEAQQMAEHHRAQAEKHSRDAMRAERVIKACLAALAVLEPQEAAYEANEMPRAY